MKIDIDKFSASKHIVIRYFEGKGGRDVKRSISMGASMTHVPAIVCAYWIGDHAGWPLEAITSIKVLVDFYGYSEITGKPEGSPL